MIFVVVVVNAAKQAGHYNDSAWLTLCLGCVLPNSGVFSVRVRICAYVKDHVVHVRVRWIMQTLKHPACTVGWVAPLCCSWLSLGKQPEFPN